MERRTTKTNTSQLVQLSLMVAVIVVMAFTPLGYLRTPGLSITLLTIPVAIGAVMLGPSGGLICGTAFGLTSFIQCFGMSAFGTMLLSISPIGAFVGSVITRMLVGLFTGLIFKAAYSHERTHKLAPYIASLACPLLNTLLFMSSFVLFFYNTDFVQNIASTLGTSNPFMFVVAFVGVQGAIEAVICFIAGSAITKTLLAVSKHK